MNLFELAAVLTLNKSSFDKGIKDARKEAEGFSGKMSGVVSGVAKGVTAAVGAAGAGIIKIVKDSVQAYGQYEQLKGGAELMFGEAYATVAENAKNAYKTVQLSQSEYLEQVSGFAVGLKTALGGDAEAAAELSHRIVQAEADVVASQGITQEAVQNAFNGIMRNNFTMLDNLRLGINPTKEGMSDLIDTVNAWNAANNKATNYQMGNLADMQSALVDYIEMQGLAGYASMEAGDTITGSLSSVQAAWKNLITGLSDKDADIGKLLTDVITQGIGAVKNLLPTIQQAIKSIGPAIKDVIPQLIETAVGLVNDNLPMLIDAAVMLVTELGSAIGENVQPIVDAALHIVDMLIKYLEDPNGLLKLVDAAIEIIEKLADGLTSALPTLLPAVVGIIMTLAEKLTDPEMLENLVIVAIDLIEALVGGILAAQDKIIEMAPVIIKNLIEAIIRIAPRLVQASIEMIMQLVSGFFGHIRKLLEVGKSIVDKVKEGFHSKVDEAKEWGKNLIDGFVKGILAKWDELKSKVTGVVDFVKNIFTGKKGLDTHSPSRWAKKVFENVLEGAEIGLNSGENALYSKTDDLVAGVQDRFDNSYTASYSTGADGSVYALLAQYLPMLASLQVYLDSGVLVGQLTPGIDQALGRRAAYAARGNA